uniref:hypothetical protein n=1 Tax=Streptomyces albidoflavus TaxID=1886 RepID=UPI002F90C333
MPAQRAADPDHERYAHIVRGVVQPPAVAEAMVTAPQWPELAGDLKKLEGAGINVGTFLTDAAPLIARMDTDLKAGVLAPGVTASPAANLRDPWVPPSQERAQREGPGMVKRIVEWVKQAVAKIVAKITGKEKPTTVLGDRSRELARLGISAQENSRMVIVARESLADESALNQIVLSREWPGIASQIKALQEAGRDPREALAGIPVRLQQAAAAGTHLSPSEAARGLLADQAKSPAPARATAPSPASTNPTPPAPNTTTPKATTSAEATAAQAPDRAAAASAQSTTATPGAAPAPGPQAARTAPTTQSTPTRTQAR